MRGADTLLFVINDEKTVTFLFREVRVGPPESCFPVGKVSESEFSASIIGKRAQNRPLSGQKRSRLLTEKPASKGEIRHFPAGPGRKGVPEHAETGSSRTRFPTPNETESIPAKAAKNPQKPSRKSPSRRPRPPRWIQAAPLIGLSRIRQNPSFPSFSVPEKSVKASFCRLTVFRWAL